MSVKPITIFICPSRNNAKKRSNEFVTFLAGYEKKYHGTQGADSEIMEAQRKNNKKIP